MFKDDFEDVKLTLPVGTQPPRPRMQFSKPLDVKRYDYLFKLIVIGDQSVGKTNLTMKFCEFGFDQNYVATIGIDFKVKTIDIVGKRVKLQIWDTAGQERFQSISKVYYRGAQGVLFVFDVTNRPSFDNVRKWIASYENASGDTSSASSDIPKVLVGNKCDDHDARIVSKEMALSVAKCYCMKYFETSARTGQNVEQVFFHIGKEMLSKLEKDRQGVELPKTVQSKLKKKKQQRHRRGWPSWSVCNVL